MSQHLDDDVIAAIVDGMDRDSYRDAIAHLSGCSECRARLAAVANLLEDPLVAAEIKTLDAQATRRQPAAYWAAGATLAAAAAITIIFAGPNKMNRRADESPAPPAEARREAALTTTAPPRILSSATVGAHDSLRWTSVPGADLYRIQVWDREGNVVFTRDTKDTTLLLSPPIIHGGSYLWEIKARTGWDRWVSSDFVELNIKPHTP